MLSKALKSAVELPTLLTRGCWLVGCERIPFHSVFVLLGIV